ncbi:MAG: hypothetical protein ACFFCF_02610 [Promethearchaeota archaeon]
MANKKPRKQFVNPLLVACLGCLLIGYSLVYPIYLVSNGSPRYAWEGLQYDSLQPIYGIVSSDSQNYNFEFEPSGLYELTVEVRNFYTNGTPVHIVCTSDGELTTLTDFYNVTAEPVNETFSFHYSSQILITVEYAGNITFFSGWVIVQGIRYPPPIPPPPYPVLYTLSPFIAGLVALGLALYWYRAEKRNNASRKWDQALIFCTLGVLLLTLSFPSVVCPHYYLYYHSSEYTDFGEFSAPVTQTVPRVNLTLTGLTQSEVALYGFHVTWSSVTVHVYSLDGSINYTWNYVNSQYPGYQTLVFDTYGDTVIEVIREAEDTAFSCWAIASHRPVEVLQTHAGAYAPFAIGFLISGVIFLVTGVHFATKGFREPSKF